MPASHLKTLGSTIEILMFMLNPPNYHIWDPSMIIHGVVTHNKFLDKNANIMFHAWTLAGNDYISIKEWIKYFHFNPLNLSVEQVLLCCADRGAGSCIDHPSIKDSKIAPNLRVNNAACKGNTLDDAWFQLYTAGTVSSYCMKYNLQSYKHQRIPSCLELQGPGFSYCSGALPLSHWNRKELNKLLLNSAKSNTLPFTPQLAQNKIDPKKTIHLPQWVDPILFIFKSMKPYKVAFPGLSNEKVIKRELYAHGPVTTAMTIYEDFEIDFANPAQNAGGRNWKKGDKIKNLIYAPKPKQAVVGGHAIMITGWGVYQGKYPYWIILNSWGVNWGHGGMPPKNNHQAPPIRLFLKNKKAMGEGYFWIKRGNNTCGIESNAVVANANIDNIVYNPESNTRIPEVKYNKYGQFMYEPEPLKAGGQWNYPFGIRSQYDPPSPFTLKWPENIKRPIYTLGTLSKDLNIKDTNLEIDSPHALHKLLHSKPDYKVLKYVPYGGTGPLANKLEKNPPKTAPIVLIDEEFVQVYEYEGGKFKILRGIWGSTPKKHAKGEQVKIFPYQNLDSKQLKTKE